MNATMISTVLGALLTLGANAATYYLTNNGTADDSDTVAFKDASFWFDKDGNPSGEKGSSLDASADYVMVSALRQTRGQAYATFGGASLRIGENADKRPHFMQYYNEGTSFKKLYFTSDGAPISSV